MRKRDENKEALVRHKALLMLVETGFDGFSMQKLAKEASISPATLYIYFKDKDDLIVQLGLEEGIKMMHASLDNFRPDMNFEEGLRLQWKNRSQYWIQNPLSTRYLEQIKHSPYRERVFSEINNEFKEVMVQFVTNAHNNNELVKVSVEAYWTVAYGPLYSLIHFHQTGHSIGAVQKPFKLTDELMEETFQLVIKALKP